MLSFACRHAPLPQPCLCAHHLHITSRMQSYEDNFWSTKMALKVGQRRVVGAGPGPHAPQRAALHCTALHCTASLHQRPPLTCPVLPCLPLPPPYRHTHQLTWDPTNAIPAPTHLPAPAPAHLCAGRQHRGAGAHQDRVRGLPGRPRQPGGREGQAGGGWLGVWGGARSKGEGQTKRGEAMLPAGFQGCGVAVVSPGVSRHPACPNRSPPSPSLATCFPPTPHPHQAGGLSEDQERVLRIMQKTFQCYITEDPRAKVGLKGCEGRACWQRA